MPRIVGTAIFSLAPSAGAIETNPLIATNPVGLVAMTGLKIGLVKYAEDLPVEEKRTVLKTSSALWGGAAANNLLVLLAAPPPLAIVAGLVTGVMVWSHMGDGYQKEDEMIAARKSLDAQQAEAATPAAEPAAPVEPVVAAAVAATAAPEIAVTANAETSGQ